MQEEQIKEPETKAFKYSLHHILNAIIVIWLEFKTYKHIERDKQLLDYCSSCGLTRLVPNMILWMLWQYFSTR